MMEMYNSNMFDISQDQQPTMYDPQLQQQQPYMFYPQVQQQHLNLYEISAQMTSSKSDFEMRNKNGDSTGNEKVAMAIEVESPPSTDDRRSKKQPKRKSYHRHKQHQIQQMEAFYQEHSHPDADQRRWLASQIGLTPTQVKFWFQNKRTQIKTEQEHKENDRLRAEYERVVVESKKYMEALSKALCVKCGGPTFNNISEISLEEQHLRIENGQLKDEVARISSRSTSNVGSLPQNEMPRQLLEVGGSSNYATQSSMETNYGSGNDIVRSFTPPTYDVKSMIAELAMAAMEELIELAKPGPPFWIPGYSSEILNIDEYMKAFPMGIGPKPLGFRTEASRESVVVIMNHMNLIEILMDVNQWATMFSSIVTRGMTLEVLSSGVAGNYNGYLQVMSAEFQIPSPLIPTRENYFVRYCKKQKEGSWAVVDVSLDHLRPCLTLRSRRRPSGCIIQELPNGYSKVTWVEHVDVDDGDVMMMQNPYRFLEKSCLAFGAKRWLASLERQCKRLANVMAINIRVGNLCEITSSEGRKSMLRLAERMMTYFCTSVGASKEHIWTPIDPTTDNDDDLKVMMRISNDEPGTGRPSGIVLSVATSFWLPVSPMRVVDFLQDNSTRNQWDILSIGGTVQEAAHIANDRDLNNRVSLLRINNENVNVGKMMLILQESWIDLTGSYIIYSPVDVAVTNLVLNGGDPNYITLLPSGFAILPDGHGQCGGCMLTAAFQILADANPTTKLSPALVATITNFIKQSIRLIKVALS